MKHVFIVNPAAGRQDATDFVRTTVENCGADVDYEIYRTSKPGDATEYIMSVLKNSDEEYRFYACGGDGTLNEVVNGVVGHDNASVTVFPCGSGNDFIKYYGTSEDFSDINELINAENTKIDVLKTCGKYAVNAVHFGFDTVVLRTMLKVRRMPVIGGRNSYTTGVVVGLIKGMKNYCKLKADGKQIGKERMLLCTLSNGRYVGGSYKCAPRSLNDDGLIEVCHVNPVSRLAFLRLISAYKKGTHLEDPRFEKYVNYTRTKKVEIEATDGFFLSLDGELVNTDKCTVEIVHKALNFAVPKKLLITADKKEETAVVG